METMTTPIEQARQQLHRAARVFEGLSQRHDREASALDRGGATAAAQQHRELAADLMRMAREGTAAADGLSEPVIRVERLQVVQESEATHGE